MTHQQIQHVQDSWTAVLPVARDAGLLFYTKLFAAAPQLQPLFKPDINGQANKLVMMLGYIVSRLRRLDELLPEVRQLALRHHAYGARPAHYDVVGQCLVATLQECLADGWTPEVADAWIAAYSTVKNVMIAS